MYEREGNLTWQDEFDGVELDAASQEEAGEGVMGLEYWWQHEEVGDSFCLYFLYFIFFVFLYFCIFLYFVFFVFCAW